MIGWLYKLANYVLKQCHPLKLRETYDIFCNFKASLCITQTPLWCLAEQPIHGFRFISSFLS